MRRNCDTLFWTCGFGLFSFQANCYKSVSVLPLNYKVRVYILGSKDMTDHVVIIC